MDEATATLTDQQVRAISNKLSEIGSYHLLDIVGEGGMGAVYRARQTDPIERDVAIKVTRLDLTSVRRLARFQAERQTLASLSHPHIATVYDAGETPDGFPYMVMEYLDGESLCEFCDRNNLSVRTRLKLFISLCSAIQHAHQKGVIHRDLKPSNVMVVNGESGPQVKVIDFGIAKIAGNGPGHTVEGGLLGTPAYMSPEQVKAPNEVDSRTDIYSLGLMLFELLTGSLPFEARSQENWSQVPDHPLRSPSAQLRTTSEGALDDLARRRGTVADSLVRELRGELDWVVLKAVQESPERRYGSAAELADDLQRYLDCFPVNARPPSRRHAFVKLLQRRRFESAAIVLLVLGLAAATVVSTRALWSAQEAQALAQQEASRANAVNGFLTDMLRSADPRVGGKDTRVVDLLDVAAQESAAAFDGQPLLEAGMLETLGFSYTGLGEPKDGAPLLERALALRKAHQGELHPDTLNAENELLETLVKFQPVASIEPRLFDLYERSQAVLPDDHPLLLTLYNNLGTIYIYIGKLEDDLDSMRRGVEFARLALEARVRVLGPDAENTSHARNNLATGHFYLEDFEQAAALYRKNLTYQQALFGPDNHYSLVTMDNLAGALEKLGQLEESERLYRAAVAGMTRLHGESHPSRLQVLADFAGFLFDNQISVLEAQALAQEVIDLAAGKEEQVRNLGDALAVLQTVAAHP